MVAGAGRRAGAGFAVRSLARGHCTQLAYVEDEDHGPRGSHAMPCGQCMLEIMASAYVQCSMGSVERCMGPAS